MAARVLNRMARACPFLSTDRFTRVMPTSSDSSVSVILRSASKVSRWTSIACSLSMSSADVRRPLTRHYTVPSRSSRMSEPARMTRARVSTAQPASTGTLSTPPYSALSTSSFTGTGTVTADARK